MDDGVEHDQDREEKTHGFYESNQWKCWSGFPHFETKLDATRVIRIEVTTTHIQ